MTLVVDKYYRKISENSDNIKIKFDISSLLVKSKEHDNKIENIYDKDYIDNNFLIESEIDNKDNEILNKINDNFYNRQYINNNYLIKGNTYDKKYIDDNFLIESEIDNKDNEILNKINNNFYNRQYINDNYLIKGNTYDKKYIDDNYFTKRVLNTSFASYNDRIDLKDKEVLEKIKNEYYDKNELDTNFNNLYNRTYLDNKFDNIYDKNEVNEKTSKLDRNLVLFNTNLTKFIDETYKNDKKVLEEDINENKSKFDNFLIKTFSAFSNNVTNLNNNQNSRLTDLENNKLSETQITKINQLENIDLGKINSSYTNSVFNKVKIDKMRHYIKEFIPFNISLVRKFTFTGNTNEIMILQFELDQREFDKNDMINFFLNITVQFDNFKNSWYKIKLRLDILYDDESIIKSFIKMPLSKGFIYHHLMNFNINRFFKLFKKTEKIIFKIYIVKVNTALVDNIVFNLNQLYENDFCDIIHYKTV